MEASRSGRVEQWLASRAKVYTEPGQTGAWADRSGRPALSPASKQLPRPLSSQHLLRENQHHRNCSPARRLYLKLCHSRPARWAPGFTVTLFVCFFLISAANQPALAAEKTRLRVDGYHIVFALLPHTHKLTASA